MTNPSTYFSGVRNEAVAEAQTLNTPSKDQSRLPHGRHSFTYTIERLKSGCLLYRLELAGSGRAESRLV
jgi:hypothetical protein